MNKTGQRSTDAVQFTLELRKRVLVDVTKSMRDVKAVADFRERAFRDVQETETFSFVAAREPFDDVRCDRVRGLS